MNKKLDRLIGQKAAEKRGKGWALTTFLREAWDSTKEEMLTNDSSRNAVGSLWRGHERYVSVAKSYLKTIETEVKARISSLLNFLYGL